MGSELDYCGRCKHGCMVAWISGDSPPKRLAGDVAGLIRSGLSVGRCTTAEARQCAKGCKECRAEREAKKPKKNSRN